MTHRLPDILPTGVPMSSIGKLIAMARPEKPRTDFGERMLEARTRAKLTQTKVCELLRISQSTLAELERYSHGSSRTVEFAMLYGVDPAWLATGSGAPQWAVAGGPRAPGRFQDRHELSPSDWAEFQDYKEAKLVPSLAAKLAEIRADLAGYRALAQPSAKQVTEAAKAKAFETIEGAPPDSSRHSGRLKNGARKP